MEKTLHKFETIQLSEMGQVSLLNRFDLKFIMHKDLGELFLETIMPNYLILEVNKKKSQNYRTAYFDTSNYSNYLNHHNGKLNRSKVRIREYIGSDLTFLECKFKNNKGKTSKKRITINEFSCELNNTHYEYLNEQFSKEVAPMINSIQVDFNRVTLVAKSMDARLTIDSNLTYKLNSIEKLKLENLMIIELKRERGTNENSVEKTLRSMSVLPANFSKYCFGMAYLYPNLKKNKFKPQRLKLIKQGLI